MLSGSNMLFDVYLRIPKLVFCHIGFVIVHRRYAASEAGEVDFADSVLFELLAQVKCCCFGLGIDHNARSVHVQTVYGVHLELQGS